LSGHVRVVLSVILSSHVRVVLSNCPVMYV